MKKYFSIQPKFDAEKGGHYPEVDNFTINKKEAGSTKFHSINVWKSNLDAPDLNYFKLNNESIFRPVLSTNYFTILSGLLINSAVKAIFSKYQVANGNFMESKVHGKVATKDYFFLWYQIRKALENRNSSGDFVPVSFEPFKEVYSSLTDKLQPQVYELGLLKQ